MHDSIIFNCISITVIQFQSILSPPKKPISMSNPSPKLLETTNLPSVCMDLPFSSISYKCNSICGLLCLASYIYNIFKVDTCCFMDQNFISLYSWIIFCGMGIAHFVYPFIGWYHFGCLHYLAIINNVAVNIYAQIFVWAYAFKSIVYILGLKLLYMSTLCLTF